MNEPAYGDKWLGYPEFAAPVLGKSSNKAQGGRFLHPSGTAANCCVNLVKGLPRGRSSSSGRRHHPRSIGQT